MKEIYCFKKHFRLALIWTLPPYQVVLIEPKYTIQATGERRHLWAYLAVTPIYYNRNLPGRLCPLTCAIEAVMLWGQTLFSDWSGRTRSHI